jgi:hypothetical protein
MHLKKLFHDKDFRFYTEGPDNISTSVLYLQYMSVLD